MASFMPARARILLIAAAVGVAVAASVAENRSDELHSWQAAWEARQSHDAERHEAERFRRDYERRRSIAHARTRSQPDTMHASRPNAAPDAMCPVVADPEVRRALQRELRQRREEAFRRATGLPLQTGLSVHPVPKRSGTQRPTAGSFAMSASSHPSTATTVFAAASSSSAAESGHMVPLFPSASDALGRQGFARVINHGDESGEVTIEAFDDQGTSRGPLTLTIGAGETIHFNSADLENGNAGKGLAGSTGPGEGDWRLELDSELDIEVLSYIRTGDGFLTAIHDTAPEGDDEHRIAIFNPGSNTNQQSLLRLVNRQDADASVTITGTDDKGRSPSEGATAVLGAHSSVTYTAAELESGNAEGLTGSIGDGSGKWRLTVESEQDIVAMSLLSSPTEHLTNLSTAPDDGTDGKHSVPLFPSASDANGRQGFLRVVNHADESGVVTIATFDDTDREYETLTLAIGANETKHFNSDDLELGNAGKGLTGSTGAGEGDWRLELTSGLDIEVLAYIRTTDGFLTAIHDPAPRSAKRHRVAVFNPGSNANQVSVLRLVNAGQESASATVTGVDDRGGSPGDGVTVTVPAGGSASYTAAELESGNAEGITGALGDGSGKWRLTVNADRPIVAMSLLSSPTGHLTNLSTAPQRGAGPVETAAEAFEALISPIVQSKCVNCHYEGNATGDMPVFVMRDADADHLATNLKEFEDYLAERDEEGVDGASRILNKIQGALGHEGGEQVAAGTDAYRGFETFLELLGADIEEFVEVDLFEGVTFESPRRTLWRAAVVFAGRTPTEEEYATVEGGDEDDLRQTVRGLMEGPEFHEFLIRGSNDRLLTDREADRSLFDSYRYFVAYINKIYGLWEDAAASGDEGKAWEWIGAVGYGVARAPLELIAHVVEGDRPYTEILTAEYVMANPMAAEAYGAATEFDDPTDAYEFKPSAIESYYPHGPDYVWDDREFGPYVEDPGPAALDIPQVGILNTRAFLQRYPTTATNRNRARSRWTYYHFLGDDIEKSEARTMDQDVLEDDNNPTMNNKACTVCHARMDPVAGAFQLFGDEGFYRDQWAGRESLAGFYKYPPGTVLPVRAESRPGETLKFTQQLLAPGDGLYIDEAESRWGSVALDSLILVDEAGTVVFEREFEDPAAGIECPREEEFGCASLGRNEETGEDDHWVVDLDFLMPLTVTARGHYDIEIVAWTNEPDRGLRVGVTPYRIGDTWYRDMRDPGFRGVAVPADEPDSLGWLARRIVDDDGFSEAAVKFWWPAIMGREIAEQPSVADDADFRVLQLAAGAQNAEVRRLAEGFRRGFGWSGEGSYNLKDLLVETVLSKWFRAETAPDDDETRANALRGAGAQRPLAPEELARKTANVVGYEWGRWIRHGQSPHRRRTSELRDDGGYRLWYGGIDSDGITERAAAMTSVMAAVAKTHASAVSCPVAMREFYFWGEEDRRLFAGLGKRVSPAWEFDAAFEIELDSEDDRQTVSASATLPAGPKTIVLSLTNEVWDEGWARTLHLDKVVVRDDLGESGFERVHEFEDMDHDCGSREDDHQALSSFCALTVDIDIPADGTYAIEVVAWGDQTDGEPAALDVVVEAAYRLLVEVWEDITGTFAAPVESDEGLFKACDMYDDADIRYYTDLLGNEALVEGGWSYDWDVVGAYHGGIDFSDSRGVVRTWVVVLAYLLTDYRYLHL